MPAGNAVKPRHKTAEVAVAMREPLLLNEGRAAEMPTVPVPQPRNEAVAEVPMRTAQEPLPRSVAR
jgi:hypothetical protein